MIYSEVPIVCRMLVVLLLTNDLTRNTYLLLHRLENIE